MGWHGNAILVRKEADILDCEPIHLPALEPRGAVMADIGLDGQTVRVIGMHLDLSGLWRRRHAAATIATIEVSTARHSTVFHVALHKWSLMAGCLLGFGRHHQLYPHGPS